MFCFVFQENRQHISMHNSIRLLLRLLCVCVTKLEAGVRPSFQWNWLSRIHGYGPAPNAGTMLNQESKILVSSVNAGQHPPICRIDLHVFLSVARTALFLGEKSVCNLVSYRNLLSYLMTLDWLHLFWIQHSKDFTPPHYERLAWNFYFWTHL